MSGGRQFHQQALELQEAGIFALALAKEMEALVAYQEAEDQIGYSEIHAMAYLTLNHLHEKTAWQGYLVTAKHIAKAGVELAKISGDEGNVAVPLFNLAKVEDKLGEKTAVNSYEEAIKLLDSSDMHNRRAVKADWENHLAVCEYKNGDGQAIKRAEEAVVRLGETNDASDYEKDVWMSGGYMRIAEALLPNNKQYAKIYLQKAKKIIDGNEELKIRKEQWRKLEEKF